MASRQLKPMTMRDLLELPVSVDLLLAGRALGITRSVAYALVKTGKFPVPVKRYGAVWRVARADILRELGLDPLMVPGDLIKTPDAA